MTAIYARGEVIDPLLKVPLERKKEKKSSVSNLNRRLRLFLSSPCTPSSILHRLLLFFSTFLFFSLVSPVLYLRAGACLKVFTNADFSSLIPLINCGYGRYDSLICSRVVVALFGGKLATGELRGPARRYQVSSSSSSSQWTATRATKQDTHTHKKKSIPKGQRRENTDSGGSGGSGGGEEPIIRPAPLAPQPLSGPVFTSGLQSFSRDNRSPVYPTSVSFIRPLQGCSGGGGSKATQTLFIHFVQRLLLLLSLFYVIFFESLT